MPWRKAQYRARRLWNHRPLFSIRAFALGLMADLRPFEPRLRGAALTGRWGLGSVLDLDVFSDRLTPVADHLRALGLRVDGNHHDHEDFPHPTLEVEHLVPVVLHVLPEAKRWPCAAGASYDELLYALRTEHARQWNFWCVPRPPPLLVSSAP